MADLVESIKRAAIEAYQSSSPTSLMFGVVYSKNPIKIGIEQRMELDQDQLVLTKSASSNINVNDRVALIRMDGGQTFLVIDKVVG